MSERILTKWRLLGTIVRAKVSGNASGHDGYILLEPVADSSRCQASV